MFVHFVEKTTEGAGFFVQGSSENVALPTHAGSHAASTPMVVCERTLFPSAPAAGTQLGRPTTSATRRATFPFTTPTSIRRPGGTAAKPFGARLPPPYLPAQSYKPPSPWPVTSQSRTPTTATTAESQTPSSSTPALSHSPAPQGPLHRPPSPKAQKPSRSHTTSRQTLAPGAASSSTQHSVLNPSSSSSPAGYTKLSARGPASPLTKFLRLHRARLSAVRMQQRKVVSNLAVAVSLSAMPSQGTNSGVRRIR